MKRKLLIASTFICAFLFTINSVNCQTNLYVNKNFEKIAKRHKNIAIIPFRTNVELRPKQVKNMKKGDIENMEKEEALGLQNGMYSWFLKRKKRGNLSINVQDPKRTNTMLKAAGISYENIEDSLPETLAEILGVDAVIVGNYSTNKPMSDGAAVAVGVLIGAWGPTNSALVNMSVNNSGDGELLWNYNKKITGSFGSSPEDLVNILMRKASRRLAYTKSDNH